MEPQDRCLLPISEVVEYLKLSESTLTDNVPPPPTTPTPLIYYIFRISVLLLVTYSITQFHTIQKSFAVLIAGAKWHRLFIEDLGVEGCSWFAKTRKSQWHSCANNLRITCTILFAPFFLFSPLFTRLAHLAERLLAQEHSIPFDSILAQSPGENKVAQYETRRFRPRWVLKVEFRLNAPLPHYEQVEWSDEIRHIGYTALGYALKSAYQNFREAGRTLLNPSPYGKGRRWSLRDRQRIAEQLLIDYGQAKGKVSATEVEYIWLDEFCLSDKHLTDPDAIQEQRNTELGRLADIFAGATKVCIFCNERDCDHSGLNCFWGTRIFSFAEVLHAPKIIRMNKTSARRTTALHSHFQLHAESSKVFKRAIQYQAEAAKQWPLQAVMQYATNGDAFLSQASIHALIVELLRRDEASNFKQHHLLGKALNGLLPRRARLADLSGKDGWADLTWLLELNQGFYNAAMLATVCSLKGSDAEADDNVVSDEDSVVVDFPVRHPWLGKPILPQPGTERVEPLVTAFPIRNPESESGESALNIVNPLLVPIYTMPKRDAYSLYKNNEMHGVKIFSVAFFILVTWLDIELIWSNYPIIFLVILWMNSVAHSILRLAASTMYIVRDGWVYLDNKQWGRNPQENLWRQDPTLMRLSRWGDEAKQPIPKWDPASDSRPGTIVDLRNGVYTNVDVVANGNALVPLAVHGSGITCMFIDHPEDVRRVSERVGMINLPTYVLNHGTRTGNICVGKRTAHIKGPQESIFPTRIKALMKDMRHRVKSLNRFTPQTKLVCSKNADQ